MLYCIRFIPSNEYGEVLFAVFELTSEDFRNLLNWRDKLLELRNEDSSFLSISVMWNYPSRAVDDLPDSFADEIHDGVLVPLESLDDVPQQHLGPRIDFSTVLVSIYGVRFYITEKHATEEVSSDRFSWAEIEKLAEGE